jgi:hypothetical protein
MIALRLICGFALLAPLQAAPLTLPAKISRLGIYSDLPGGKIADDFSHYTVNVSFWSDGADKERWFKLPAGKKIKFHSSGAWEFPAGSMFVKQFAMGKSGGAHRIETRVLYLQAPGQVFGASYAWNEQGTDAELVTTNRVSILSTLKRADGKSVEWFFPGPRDCLLCHTPLSGGVLGLNTRQLNRTSGLNGQNQIAELGRAGLFENPPPSLKGLGQLKKISNPACSLSEKVRSYLDANCSFCHQPGGAAGNFDARFHTPLEKQFLVDGPVLIDLNLDGARVIAPKDLDRSILLNRISTMDGLKMPPLGHRTVDSEGVALIQNWILSLPGEPVLKPPIILMTQAAAGRYSIEMTTENQQDEIRYSLDGSTPGKDSLLYADAITVTPPVIIRARSYHPGFKKSISAQKVISK